MLGVICQAPYHAAGALGGYLWKHREVNQTTEKLLSIAGIAALSLAMGWSNETKVDNLGKLRRVHTSTCMSYWGMHQHMGRGRGEGACHCLHFAHTVQEHPSPDNSVLR